MLIVKMPICDEWKKIAQAFEIRHHFLHCLGAMDGKQ